ncbi:predicted protein [Sclerotinia sclerotiorum 1980 UF-70]|uniref:Uncharacterized protein n=2 Tax=Sclerotinia sclerotiorum (strain ATCC 18683 / 1980 / Ss-1) TaxID=665079 RepID=A7EX45_SCLS1|nr:predicted protein [Sclerotinia sclerotiorum 1980 UF-70]APA05475.1 hypothetical protein sscle_01g002450 [Sclerotinia sclerotiorum 1980 UF-70]EDN94037.1 predicted protein [Sclerotinia sclerotiorum 1980 UF-70]
MFDVTLVPSKDSAGSEWSKGKTSSHSSIVYLAETDKFEELHLDDAKDDN